MDKTIFCRFQAVIEFTFIGAEQVMTITVPVVVLASTVGEIVTVAELIRNPLNTAFARATASSDVPPTAETTFPAS